MEFKHVSVLLDECIEGLNIKPDGIYLDGTLGGAGHSKEILKKLSPNGILIGVDRDEEALKAARQNLKDFKNVKYIHNNHDNIKEILQELDFEDKVLLSDISVPEGIELEEFADDLVGIVISSQTVEEEEPETDEETEADEVPLVDEE